MNKQTIISLINEPGLIQNEHLEELKNLSEQYPYSGAIQMLYSKALHNDGNIQFEEQLKLAAITCTNRKKLYQLIHQPKLRQIIEEVEEVAENLPVVVEEAPTQQEEPVNITTTEEEVSTSEEKAQEKTDNIDKLEENVLLEAINSSIQIDINEYEFEESKEEEKDNNEETASPSTSNTASPTSFSGWFGKPTTPTPPPSKKKKEDTTSLINSFIEREDERLTPKAEFFSPSNLGKMSLVDNEEFVTETLAKVYAAQENFEKAIRIYEQLSLNNPEKKTFFASRIRFLKEKLQNKND